MTTSQGPSAEDQKKAGCVVAGALGLGALLTGYALLNPNKPEPLPELKNPWHERVAKEKNNGKWAEGEKAQPPVAAPVRDVDITLEPHEAEKVGKHLDKVQALIDFILEEAKLNNKPEISEQLKFTVLGLQAMRESLDKIPPSVNSRTLQGISAYSPKGGGDELDALGGNMYADPVLQEAFRGRVASHLQQIAEAAKDVKPFALKKLQPLMVEKGAER